MVKRSDELLRERWIQRAVQVEAMSIGWVALEAGLGAIAAVQGGSLAMSAFSVDSAVELISGIVLLVRLLGEARTVRWKESAALERIASAVVAGCLFSLAAFISFRSGQALAAHQAPTMSTLGLCIAAVSSVVTPWLARTKRQLGVLLHSHALIGDAACSMTCAYMAWTLLAGLLLQWLCGWGWVDPVAAIGILYFVLKEAWEAAQAAWSGQAHIHAH